MVFWKVFLLRASYFLFLRGPPIIYSKQMGVSSPNEIAYGDVFWYDPSKAWKAVMLITLSLFYPAAKEISLMKLSWYMKLNIHMCCLIRTTLNKYGQLAGHDWPAGRLKWDVRIMGWVDKLTPFKRVHNGVNHQLDLIDSGSGMDCNSRKRCFGMGEN